MCAFRPLAGAAATAGLAGTVLAVADGDGLSQNGAATDGDPATLILSLDPDLDAAAKARDALVALEDEIERRVLEDMHLLVTELVTNSVRHSAATADEPVRVEVAVGGDHVFVAVEDGGTGFRPAPRRSDSPHDSGWGLHLVEQLSSRWGVSSDGRTRVWLELPRG